jgi:NAD(P)-dependent dehydrogenase (short-subunit alcohol dehydrogenase family)
MEVVKLGSPSRGAHFVGVPNAKEGECRGGREGGEHRSGQGRSGRAFGRAAEPWEVAATIAFLASDYPSYLARRSDLGIKPAPVS